MAWLAKMPTPPGQTFVVHGEQDAADTLRLRIADELHWPVATVEHLQSVVV